MQLLGGIRLCRFERARHCPFHIVQSKTMHTVAYVSLPGPPQSLVIERAASYMGDYNSIPGPNGLKDMLGACAHVHAPDPNRMEK